MRLITHLSFNGHCEAAFKLYEECLDGEIQFMMTYTASATAFADPTLADKIFHATLRIGDQTITGVDLPSATYKTPQGFALQLNLDDPGEAFRIFSTLAEAGTILLPLQKTMWATHYGLLTDRFGTPWEINCA